jgi:predicted lysophospholipase L1 biosynthesis ABC-type transport system permease subunit
MITMTIVVGQDMKSRARLKQPSRSAMGRLNLSYNQQQPKRMMLTRKHWDSSEEEKMMMILRGNSLGRYP